MFRSIPVLAVGLTALCIGNTAQAFSAPGWIENGLEAGREELRALNEEGKPDFYLPVRTWHMPYAYTAEQRHRYNNDPLPAFGVGLGRYTATGNRSGVYAMGFKDSNNKWSAMAGYGYTWQQGLADSFNYGLGVTAGLMTRADYFGRTPFPAILPTFTAGYDRFKIEAGYVPGFRSGSGSVMFFWLKHELK